MHISDEEISVVKIISLWELSA